MDSMMEKLHDEFGKLPAEFENLKKDFGRISDTFEKLDNVSDRMQGVSARMQGLMSEFGRLQDLMEDTLLRNVQDSQAVLIELQGHSFEMKTSLTALCADMQKLLSTHGDFKTAVANSFQDMFVVQQEHTKRFDSWHQNPQQWREKVQQFLEKISDRCESQSSQMVVSQSLMSDARLHAVNTSLVSILNHLGLTVNPKMVPAMPVKSKDPSPAPTPQKQPPNSGPGAPGLKANLAAARTTTTQRNLTLWLLGEG